MKIHILTAFSRRRCKKFWEHKISGLNIIWHPIIHRKDIKFSGKNIEPFFVSELYRGVDIPYFKYNMYMISGKIINEDRYCFINDDDWVEDNFFNKIKNYNDEVLFVSMKRGYNKPKNSHPVSTINVSQEEDHKKYGVEQYLPLGKICNQIRFRTDTMKNNDGTMAEYLKNNFQCKYIPDLYIYFNYLEKGRWNKKNE